jgi:endoglucanase
MITMQLPSLAPTFRSTYLIMVILLTTACAATPTAPAVPTSTAVPTPVPTLTSEPAVDAFTMNQRLSHAVNLANALEAPNEGDWGLVLHEEYFQLVKEAGFTAVRIPIRWNAHAMLSAPYTIAPEFFKRIDWAVEQSLSRGLVVVLDFHNYDELILDTTNNKERFVELWKQIAEHYQSYPNNVVFELLNEPSGQLVASTWNKVIESTLAVIRVSNPDRNIVIGPAQYNDLDSLKDIKLPADDQHIIVTFHYYNPYQFTHQGAEWVQGSSSWVGTTWKSSSAQKQYVDFDFNIVAQWATENNRPIFLGEFGTYNKADMTSRALWTAYVAREAEKLGFSWSYWEFGAGFGVYDPAAKKWNEPLLQALIPKP